MLYNFIHNLINISTYETLLTAIKKSKKIGKYLETIKYA
jgi:hypothetical protein